VEEGPETITGASWNVFGAAVEFLSADGAIFSVYL
jgi:hypothetical protein